MKTADQFPPEFVAWNPMKRAGIALAAAFMVAAFAIPAQAQISGPYVSPNGQETYEGSTTDPNFSPYTPQQQNWDRNNLETTGTGEGHIGTLRRYEINAGGVSRGNKTLNIQLGWMPPSADAGRVKDVDFKIMGGRRAGSQPIRVITGGCPPGKHGSLYKMTSGGTLDLNDAFTLQKCSDFFPEIVNTDAGINSPPHSMVLRLTGKMVLLPDGGYVASFGSHNSEWNCGPPTWPTRAHQAAGHPPYAEWCDLSVYWSSR